MENRSPEYLWGQMTDLFNAILTENYNLKLAARNAVDQIQKLEDDPDYGNAWEAQAILIKALGISKQAVREGWDA